MRLLIGNISRTEYLNIQTFTYTFLYFIPCVIIWHIILLKLSSLSNQHSHSQYLAKYRQIF